VCYSPAYRAEQSIGWHLAPVAVHPEWQKRGHGSNLIRQTLAQADISGSPVFVLGDPGYYRRFGFYPVRQPQCPFEPRNEHFMALRYNCQDSFVIGYEKEFGGGEPDAPAHGSQPFRSGSGDKSNVGGGWLPSLARALGSSVGGTLHGLHN
jgi:hypothetical protein